MLNTFKRHKNNDKVANILFIDNFITDGNISMQTLTRMGYCPLSKQSIKLLSQHVTCQAKCQIINIK